MSEPYPTTLPNPSANFSGTTAAPVLRTEMDSGLVRQQSRFATSLRTYNVSWEFDAAEFEDFKTFFHTTLANGTKTFQLPMMTDGGLTTIDVKFAGGVYNQRYVPVDRWNVSATLEEEVVQLVAATPNPVTPVWFQPERDILINTVLNNTYANNLLHCYPSPGENLFLTVPEIESASDLLPIGVVNHGPGNVVIKVNEDTEVVDPEETWMSLAASLGAWAIYRMDESVVTEAGKVVGLNDLSTNVHHLRDYTASNTTKATWASGWLRSAYSGAGFIGTPMRSNPLLVSSELFSINLPTYAVLVVGRFPTVSEAVGAVFTTAWEDGGVFNRTSLFLGGTHEWALYQSSSTGSAVVSHESPTSGSTPRLMEYAVVAPTSKATLLINGFPVTANAYNTQNMTRLQLGGWGPTTGPLWTPTAEFAAAVVFSGSTVASLYTDRDQQKTMARLRQLMLDEFAP